MSMRSHGRSEQHGDISYPLPGIAEHYSPIWRFGVDREPHCGWGGGRPRYNPGMDDLGSEFLTLYNELDHLLQKITGERGGVPFWKRLRIAAKKDPVIKRHLDDLLEFHELRNAIIHHRSYPKELIAIPTAEVVAEFRQVVQRLSAPPRVIPAFASEVHVFSPSTPLREVLQYMYSRGYSQVVSRAEGRLRLTTSSGITRWLAAGVNAGEVPFESATLGDVLPFDREEALQLIGKDASIDEALGVFQQSLERKRPRLFAIVITETGDAGENPLGIITPRDLLVEE